MQIDTIRALFTYLLALVTVIGGLAIIYFTRTDINASEVRLMIAGFIGSSLTFAYGTEVQARTARQAAASTLAANAAVSTNGNGAVHG
jgi:hypothetical protein